MNLFFYLSKILWFFAAPSNFLVFAAGVGLALAAFSRARRAGLALAGGAGLLLAICGLAPIGALLLWPLENRVPRATEFPPPTGIVVLGGAVHELLTEARGQVALDLAAERMTEAVALSRRYPQAELVFTGGNNSLLGSPYTEAGVARRLWRELGVPDARMRFEDKSRNTYENAIFTKALVDPKPGETWLLVTSAWHMPRALGLFRKAGFAVVPYPVDYRTFGDRRDLRIGREVSAGLSMVDMATREWIGLLAYRIAGRTDALLPAP